MRLLIVAVVVVVVAAVLVVVVLGREGRLGRWRLRRVVGRVVADFSSAAKGARRR